MREDGGRYELSSNMHMTIRMGAEPMPHVQYELCGFLLPGDMSLSPFGLWRNSSTFLLSYDP